MRIHSVQLRVLWKGTSRWLSSYATRLLLASLVRLFHFVNFDRLIDVIILDDIASRSLNVDALTGTSTKPSFLIWDKVYQKLTEAEDAQWLLRAADLVVPKLEADLLKHQHLR